MAREEASIRGEGVYVPPPPHLTGSALSGGSARTPAKSSSSGSRASTVTSKTALAAAQTQQKTELDLRELALSYGLLYDEIQAIPELKALFQKAVDQGYSATRFTAELKNSTWWRSTSDSQRKYLDLQYSDPTTFRQKWDETANRLNTMLVQFGVPSLTYKGTDPATMDYALAAVTKAAMAEGWSDDRVKSWIGARLDWWSPDQLGGEITRNFTQLHNLAYTNGRDYTSDWYNQQIKQVAGGQKTMEQVEQEIRQQAAADYKAFSTQILAGQNAMDLAAPYLRTVSTLLEKPDGAVNLNDPLMRKAMTTQNQDGSAYGVWQLENDVRSDTRWRQTGNARESLMKLGHAVLSDYGLTF